MVTASPISGGTTTSAPGAMIDDGNLAANSGVGFLGPEGAENDEDLAGMHRTQPAVLTDASRRDPR